MSTPAMSHLVRTLNKEKPDSCMGAILLTASHNPGGETEDFGIKFNTPNGGPALESLTDAVFERSKVIDKLMMVPNLPEVDISKTQEAEFDIGSGEGESKLNISVIDPADAYITLMKELFDFDQIKALLKRADFEMCFDGMHGAAGPYANKIFVSELSCPAEALMRCQILPDFGKGHPDPNLTYAPELVAKMGIFEPKNDAP